MFSYPVAWTRVSWLTYLLAPLSGLFGIAVMLRRLLYQAEVLRSEHMPVPVIVVGNISVGGTGKTPLVLWLVAQLRAAGYRPGIISRGYGGATRSPQAVFKDSDARRCGDEPVVLARRSGCAVWTGRNRPAVARALINQNPDCNVIISDDGLQHYRLARDFEIAVTDGERGHGNGWMLPAGPLREAPSRLATVDAVVVRGKSQAAPPLPAAPPHHVMTLAPGALCSVRDISCCVPPDHFKGLRVHALAGIGNPQQFFDTLAQLGIAHTPHAFADHHPYSESDLAYGDCDAIVMTEKDAVKCERYATDKHWMLRVEAQVDPALARSVLARIKGKH
jgi:tetraacyldisaccharide 4'-kinase